MNLSLESRFKELSLGKLQSVKGMTIIPLCSDITYDQIADPSALKLEGNRSYGEMVFSNQSDKISVVPSNFMAIVKSSVQDHAMSTAGMIAGSERARYTNACCVQSNQGGYIKEGMESEFNVMPLSLRSALNEDKREQESYDKLWRNIEKFNQGVTSRSGAHIEYFFKEYEDDLEQFVAEFEPVQNQVGALIFFGENLVGVEIAPTYKYWEESWTWLVRGCYGSEFIRQSKLGKTFEKMPLPDLECDFSLDKVEDILDDFVEITTVNLASKVAGAWKLEGSTYQQIRENSLVYIRTDKLAGDVMFMDQTPVYVSLYHKSIDKDVKV